jgi:hypothetical protein
LTVAATLGAIVMGIGFAATAEAAVLSGGVSGQVGSLPPQPIADATVVVLDRATGETVTSTTTDMAGRYSVTVSPAIYDVRFVPGPGQLVASTTARDIDVTSDHVLDVVLVPPGSVRLSGTIRDSNGVPEQGVQVRLDPGDTVTTGADGGYSFVATAGEAFKLRANAQPGDADPAVPDAWSFVTTPFPLHADRELDVTLPPTALVTVRVLDDDDAPVAGAQIRLPGLNGTHALGDLTGGLSSSAKTSTSDAAGEARFRVFTGSDATRGGSITPPAGSDYGVTSYAIDAVTGDVTIIVKLDPLPSVARLSGVIRDSTGAPQQGVEVRLDPGNPVTTGSDGRYEFIAAPRDDYKLRINAQPGDSNPAVPPVWAVTISTFSLQADQERDIVLPPVAHVTVRALEENDVPMTGAQIRFPGMGASQDLGGFTGSVSSGQRTASSDTAGEARFRVFTGSYGSSGGRITPPSGSGYDVGLFSVGAITGDTTVVVQMPRPHTVQLSGVIRDSTGAPQEGVEVELDPGDSVTTGSDGRYEFTTAPGDYFKLRANAQPGDSNLAVPGAWALTTLPFPLQTDQEQDIVLPPVSHVTVRALKENDVPFVGARMLLPGLNLSHDFGDLEGGASSGGQSAIADVNGEARFRFFTGSGVTGDGAVIPPAGSGYGVGHYTIDHTDRDTTIVVRFQGGDATAPSIVCDADSGAWHAENVSIACSASDAESGLADPGEAQFALTTTVPDGEETDSAETDARQVCDNAGNCATAGPIAGIRVDRAAPRFRFEQSPNGQHGWFVTLPGGASAVAEDVTITSLSCTLDGEASGQVPLAGPGSLRLDFTTNREGRHPIECVATDVLGHSGTGSGSILIDGTRPARPTATTDRPPDFGGGGGWYRDHVTVAFVDRGDPDLADGSPGSGVDPVASTQPQTVATSGVHQIIGTVADVAGNRSQERSITVRVDADPPTSELTCPESPVLGSKARVRWRDQDGESGIMGAARGSQLVDTGALGTYTVVHVATDDVGHETTSECTYEVV